MITQNITLDITGRSSWVYVHAKQGDSETRQVRVTLTENGAAYSPEGVTANFRARKPDGTMICNPATINSDGTVTIELTQQTLAAAGAVLADVCLCGEDGTVLSTASFIIMVDVMPQGDLEESANEWLALWNRLYALELGYATDEQVNAAAAAYLEENPPEGTVYTPELSVDGVLSWTNDRGLPNPGSVNIVQLVVDAMGGQPVLGVVDDENTITLSSVLADGSYVLRYEDAEGNVTEIGTVKVSGTGEDTEVNLFDASLAALNVRWSNSAYGYVTANGYVASYYIPVTVSDDESKPTMLHWRGGEMTNSANIIYFDSSRTVIAASDMSTTGVGTTPATMTITTDENGDYQTPLGYKNGVLESGWLSAAYIRVCLQLNTDSTALTESDISGIVMTIDELIE